MSPESIRSLILGREPSPPYEIHTTGGKRYRIESAATDGPIVGAGAGGLASVRGIDRSIR